MWYYSVLRDVKLRAWICRLMDLFWTLHRRPHISGFSREQLAPSTHNESAPEQGMHCSVNFAGLYGRNGFNPMVSAKIWTTYIRPRLLHRAELWRELWCLDNTNTNILEKFQPDRLKQLQGLPPRTSNCVTLAIMGMFPIEAEIDRKSLTFFRNIIKDKNRV